MLASEIGGNGQKNGSFYVAKRVFFKLCNAVTNFLRLRQRALIGSLLKHRVIYLDDILDFGAGSSTR